MTYDPEKQKIVNEQHASNPLPGDYWEEHCCGICVVLEVTPYAVTLCETMKPTDRNHWTWDLSVTRSMGRKEFKKWLSYDAIEGYWADAHSEAHKWVFGNPEQK
jgi:hypothetical protein